MRNALLAVMAVVAAVFAGWILDDKILGGDIARNTSISGVEVGRLDIDEAAELLTDGRLTDRPVELRHGTNSLTVTAAELGVMVDTELALANAAERPSLVSQPIRWIGSLFENRSFDVSYMIDVDVLPDTTSTSVFLSSNSSTDASSKPIPPRCLPPTPTSSAIASSTQPSPGATEPP